MTPAESNITSLSNNLSTSRTELWTVRVTTAALVTAPLAAIVGIAIWGLTPQWWDVSLGVVLYFLSIAGISLGFHRMLTHNSFVAKPWLRAMLVGAGCLSMEGAPIGWVALHRRHHQYSDRDGDPHSPHQFGAGAWGVTRGFLHAHVGWLFGGMETQVEKYAPDMLKDRVVQKVDAAWWIIGLSGMLALPAAVGLAFGGWSGALSCVLWAGIVRMGLVHHVTWSVNSICHLWGKRPFASRDESRNVAWLAIPSMGESFHNGHHAFPSSARHGLLPHQWDPSARIIRWMEIAGWVDNVKWMSANVLARRTLTPL